MKTVILLLFVVSNTCFALSLSDYEECNLEGESPEANCSIFNILLKTGGGFDVWNHMPKFSDYKDTIRPYKKEFVVASFNSAFAHSFADILYRDLEKIWGCLAKDDLECLASMTYIARYDQFTSNPQPLDKVKKGKWRISAEKETYPGYKCKEMGEYFPGIKENYVNPTNGSPVYKVEPYVAFSDPLKFYQCLFTYQPKVSATDPLRITDPLWQRGVSMSSYGSIKNLLRTTFLDTDERNKIDENKSLKENYPIPFYIRLAHSSMYDDSIILLYGTPANPNGFAIAGFGKYALNCRHFCYENFKDGP